MPTEIEGATDEIYSKLKADWDSLAPDAVDISPTIPQLVYEEKEHGLKPHPSTVAAPWGRVVLRHNSGIQRTLGPKGSRLFERGGNFWVQCFVPMLSGSGKTLCQRLAKVAQNAYEGERTVNVNFSDVTTAEKGKDGTFYRYDVTGKFKWLELK